MGETHLSRESISSTQPQQRDMSKPSDSNEQADAEKDFKSKSFQFWLIMISIYFCFILVALDRMIVGTYPSILQSTFLTHSSHCDTCNHEYLWFHLRHWVVWQRIHAHMCHLQSALRQALPTVRYEADIPYRNLHI